MTKRRALRTTPDVSYHPSMRPTPKQRALQVIKEMGIARPRELATRGITRSQISRLVEDGLVLRQARGIYIVARHAPTAEHTLAQVAKRVPEGIFCLLTALRFHEPQRTQHTRNFSRALQTNVRFTDR